jgi:hypothetical protein
MAAFRRSRRQGFVERQLLPLIWVVPLRCKECLYRRYAFAFQPRRAEHIAQRPVCASESPILWRMAAAVFVAGVVMLATVRAETSAFVQWFTASPEPEVLPAPARVQWISSGMEVPRRMMSVPSVRWLPREHSAEAWARVQEPAPEPLGMLAVSGEVYVNNTRVTLEQTVFYGDTVRTGPQSAAAVSVSGRGQLVIEAGTRVTFHKQLRYFAQLEQGGVVLKCLAGARNMQVRFGNLTVVPSPESDAVVEILRSADGATRVTLVQGGAGVIALEGPYADFLRLGESLRFDATDQPVLREEAPRAHEPASQPPAPKQSPGPEVKKGGGGAKWGLLAAAGGGAAAAAALAGGKKGGTTTQQPTSPFRP